MQCGRGDVWREGSSERVGRVQSMSALRVPGRTSDFYLNAMGSPVREQCVGFGHGQIYGTKSKARPRADTQHIYGMDWRVSNTAVIGSLG